MPGPLPFVQPSVLVPGFVLLFPDILPRLLSEGSNLPSAPDNPAMSTKQPHVDQNVALSKATENENAKDLELTKLPQLSEQTKPSIVGTFFVMLASLLGLGSLLDKKRKDQ